MKFVNR